MTHLEYRTQVAKHDAWIQKRDLCDRIAKQFAAEDLDGERIKKHEFDAREWYYIEQLRATLGEQPEHPASREQAAKKLNMLRRK